jgi:hypothetical protein
VVDLIEPAPGDFIEPAPTDFVEPAPGDFIEPTPSELAQGDEEDQSFLGSVVDTGITAGQELGRAVPSAALSLLQGVSELGASGLDLVFGTNTSRSVTDNFEYVKSYVKPETAGGKLAEDVISFGLGFVPIAGWLGRASSAAKAVNAGKTVIPGTSRYLRTADNFGVSEIGRKLLGTKKGLIGTTAAAAAGFETIVTPDGRATLSDTFSLGGPLETEDDTGLSGREEALRRIRNKLRSGAEGGLFSGAFDTALLGVGKGVGYLGSTDVASAAARGIRSGFEAAKEGLRKLPGAETVGSTVENYFTAARGADPRVFEEAMDVTARVDAINSAAVSAFDEFTAAARAEVGGPLARAIKGRRAVAQANKDLTRYLTGLGPDLSSYGPKVNAAAERVKEAALRETDRLFTALEREVQLAPPGARRQVLEEAMKTMAEHSRQQKGVLRRLFKVYEDPIAYYKSLDLKGKDADLFKNAVDEVAKNLDPSNAFAPEVQALARYKVNEAIGLGQINTGMDPSAAIKEKLSSLKADTVNPKGGLFAMEMPRFKMTRSLLTPREPMIDKSPVLRQLLGEIDDPRELFIKTIGDLSKTAEALRFYQNISTSAMTASLADAIPAIREGGKPLFVKVPEPGQDLTGFDMTPFIQEAQRLSAATTLPDPTSGIPLQFSGAVRPEEVIQTYTNELKQSGYVRLGEADPMVKEVLDTELPKIDPFGGQYGQLSGLYVSPETYRVLSAPARIGITGLDEFVSILAQMKGLSQKMTVVPNIASQMRSAIGNALALVGTANLGRSTDVFDVYQVFTANLKDLDDAGLERLAKVISLSGTSETNLVIKALQEYKDAGADLPLSGKLRNIIDKGESLVPFLKFFERTFSGVDSFFKGVGVISEQNKLLEAFAKAGLDQPIPDLLEDMVAQGIGRRTSSLTNPGLSAVEIMAADAVKDMFPIQNRIGLFVRELDKLPVLGAFTSFASENIRNSVNILDRALKEMSYRVSEVPRGRLGEEQAKAFERAIRAHGAQRLMAYAAVAAIIPKSVVGGSMMATNTSQEQLDALHAETKKLLPGHDLAVISNDQNGKLEYVDLGYVMPYAFVTDSAVAGLRAYNEAGRLGKSEAAAIADSVWASVMAYSDPFASEAMSIERVLDVMPWARGGKTKNGSIVYRQSAPLSEKIISSINHLSAPYVPGYIRDFVEVRGGEIRPGPITRSVIEMPTAQGRDLNLSSEFAKLVTGLKPMELNLRRDFQFVGGEYSPRRTDTKSAALANIRAADRTPEEMIQGWNDYLDNLYREQAALYARIQNARALGLSEQSIRRQLAKEANIGTNEVGSIMRGEFYPGNVTEELLNEIRMVERAEKLNRVTPSSRIPFREFIRASRARTREKLIPTPEAEEQGLLEPSPSDFTEPNPSDFTVPAGGAGGGSRSMQGAALPPPAFDQVPAPSAPQLPTAPANRASLSPSLLGGDLASQMANTEIAQRLRG